MDHHFRFGSQPLAMLIFFLGCGMLFSSSSMGQQAVVYPLTKRTVVRESELLAHRQTQVNWDAKKTAVIVCDVWDYHHSINAVRRLEEMLPSMEKLLQKARSSGSIVIHSPSDCMPYYADHPSRLRAKQVTKVNLPSRIASWNSKIAKEEGGLYPLDQSDGGEDDDPQEHRQWAEKLKGLGRDPGLPWKSQNAALSIDGSRDYISDQGDEVWGILTSNEIQHVIMIGVHTNMCVLGRPFGLRQLANNQIDVVLVRDLTDCMYNPKRWPYVDHYTGNDLMIAYIEEHVCPTVSSEQLIGGDPVMFSGASRENRGVLGLGVSMPEFRADEWQLGDWSEMIEKCRSQKVGKVLVRFSLSIQPEVFNDSVTISHPGLKSVWVNGNALKLAKNSSSLSSFQVEAAQTFRNDDANVLVMELDVGEKSQNPQVLASGALPIVMSSSGALTLTQKVQFKTSWGQSDTNLPLPAKFALPPAVYYALLVD